MCGLPPEVLPEVADPGTVVGGVTAEAAAADRPASGHPGRRRGSRHPARAARRGVAGRQFTVLAGTFWQHTILTTEPLIDPQARLRTLCHVIPGEWMLEGIGFYCGMAMRWYRDAFCAAEARPRGSAARPVRGDGRGGGPVPPGSNGVYAILSNLMNARHWVHASPAFVGFDLGDPARVRPGGRIRAVEEAAAYVSAGTSGSP